MKEAKHGVERLKFVNNINCYINLVSNTYYCKNILPDMPYYNMYNIFIIPHLTSKSINT